MDVIAKTVPSVHVTGIIGADCFAAMNLRRNDFERLSIAALALV
jgi:hypothetical protein